MDGPPCWPCACALRLLLALCIELLAQRMEGILGIVGGFLDAVDVVALRGLLEVVDLAFDGAAFR